MSVSHEHENESHARPNYFGVFIGLGVLTLLEVGVTFLPIPQVPILVAMMIAKVALVAMYYMHLKYDSKWFTVIILTPAPFVALIVVALLVAS